MSPIGGAIVAKAHRLIHPRPVRVVSHLGGPHAYRRTLEHSAENDARRIDPCPTCAATVRTIETARVNGQHVAHPCGHRVSVTIWPGRVALAATLTARAAPVECEHGVFSHCSSCCPIPPEVGAP